MRRYNVSNKVYFSVEKNCFPHWRIRIRISCFVFLSIVSISRSTLGVFRTREPKEGEKREREWDEEPSRGRIIHKRGGFSLINCICQ